MVNFDYLQAFYKFNSYKTYFNNYITIKYTFIINFYEIIMNKNLFLMEYYTLVTIKIYSQ
jgi:hypothetical protein